MTKSLKTSAKAQFTTGVDYLDQLLGGLLVGDNVVWHDDSGSLASAFCHKFIQSSLDRKRPLIYTCFDRSPRNLLEKLAPLELNNTVTILDCFTSGKGANSPIFLRFYNEADSLPCRVIRVKEPGRSEEVMDILYGVHAEFSGDVRLVFESITGMQELWGGEENIISFYSHTCPRLYELNTLAYWIMEKKAHSPRLRAHISQIAQVVIELAIRRGTSSLSILKAENRASDNFHKPFNYWVRDLTIAFQEEKRTGGIDLGFHLKDLRSRRGFSQTELAKLVGVTPSTISQVESNLIYPSLPALLKMAEVLSVEISSFFQDKTDERTRTVFPASEATEIKLPGLNDENIRSHSLTPIDLDSKAEPYLIEIPPEKTLNTHFFTHKGEELGYMISGELQFRIDNETYTVKQGDLIYLTMNTPGQWKNNGEATARVLWIKLK